MTITKFLLARIAEDEAWADARERWTALNLPDTAVARRLRKECEAKRQILEQLLALEITNDGDYGGAWSEGMTYALELAVQWHAAVYAGHPDYREEWRS